jgi:putative flippase GtrA
MKPATSAWYEVLVLRLLALALAFAISVGAGWLITGVLIDIADWLLAAKTAAQAVEGG